MLLLLHRVRQIKKSSCSTIEKQTKTANSLGIRLIEKKITRAEKMMLCLD